MLIRLLVLGSLLWQVITLPAWALETLSLREAWGAGLEHDVNFRNAQAALLRARIGIDQARGEQFQYGGDLNVGNRYGVMGLLGAGPITAMNSPLANATVMARWPIFTGGKVEQGIAQAETQSLIQAARVAQTRENALYGVAEAYWDLKRAQLRLDTQKLALLDARSQLNLVGSRVRTGRAEAHDLSQAEIGIATAEDGVIQGEAELKTAYLKLSRLLGREVGDLRLDEPTVTEKEAETALDTCVAVALQHRPELQISRLQLAQCGLQVQLAKAEKTPQIDLISAYQHGNNPFIATVSNRDLLNAFTGVWDARLNLSLRAFDHGVIDRQIQLRENELAAEQTAASLTEKQIRIDVKRAWESLVQARRRVVVTRQGEVLALRYHQQIQARYRLGFGLAYLVDEARNRVASARNRAIDAAIDAELARLALLVAQGRLGLTWAKLTEGAS